jgi:stage II sporulation protein AA (anti-sigma F factor antagonist)
MSTPKTFRTESDGATLVVALLGNVSSLADEGIRPELEDLLAQLRRPGLKNVVIDFENVSYFGTIMLEALHAIWRCVRQGGGNMALCNVSAMGREILHVSGFHALWSVCASRKEALEAVRGQTP